MASIFFEVLDNVDGLNGVNGSGLGFYGSTFGASVSTSNYQDSTYVTNANGDTNGGVARNVKYLSPTGCYLTPAAATGQLLNTNGSEATLIIHFQHTTNVKVQNCQLRIYDRDNINTAASGVITKVAELVNFGGQSFGAWSSGNYGSDIVSSSGFGDAFWWGSPWPSGSTYAGVNISPATPIRPSYTNSVGVVFPNFTDYQFDRGSGNPDPSVSGLTSPGFETVGGTGIIVPLLDSPGSGGRHLASGAANGSFKPKYIQYVDSTRQTAILPNVATAFSTGVAANLSGSYGGTGYDLRHTWRVALSARPLNIGSKTQYGLYVSLEYL
jgi:hypothetical protein